MASIVWADVEAHFSDLASVGVAAQTDILAHVNVALDVSCFGGETHAKTKLARIYLAAHTGLANLSSLLASGAIVEETVGDLSRKYGVAVTGATGSDYATTGPGRLFRQLVRSSKARVPLVL